MEEKLRYENSECKMKHLGSIVDNILSKSPLTVKSGIALLDQMGLKFSPGGLYLIGSRPGMGKTSLMLDIALHAAKDAGVPIWLFSLEMSEEQIAMRLLSKYANVSLLKIRRGDPDCKAILAQSKNDLAHLPISICDKAITIEEIRQTIRNAESPGLVFIDYLQLIDIGTEQYSKNNNVICSVPSAKRQDEICVNLKKTAQEENVPIIVLSQLSRRLETRKNKRPRLGDTRYSRIIERLSDAVVFLYRDSYYNDSKQRGRSDEMELIVVKNTHGETGTAVVSFEEIVHFA